ncbi:MAG TPA: tripartite tricarboxylate transporter TctB family protein [Noviherbaspirillum sp.]
MNSTIVLGIASIALALVFRAQSTDLPVEALRLPSLLIWVVIALGAMMIIEEVIKLRRARRADPDTAKTALDDDEPLPPVNWPVLAVFGAASLAYVVLIPIAGYLLVTPLFLIGGIWLTKTVSLARAALIAVFMTAIIWVIFVWMLQLPVPLLPALN